MTLDPPDYKKFFEYWCAHLAERIVRFDRYLTERAADAPSHRKAKHNVIENLRHDINSTAQELHRAAHRIYQRRTIPRDDTTTYAASLQTIIREIADAHYRLAYLPQPWAEPDTEILIKGVIRENIRPPSLLPNETALKDFDAWTIVLTNEYNLSNIMIDKGNPPFGEINPFPHVLSLPAIEKDNTIAWVNLFHEVGHSIATMYKIKEAFVENDKTCVSPSEAEKMIMGDWLDEIIADLIAIDIGGPAYLYAFATFALYMTCSPIRRPSNRYPSPEVRFKYLFERLSQNVGAELTKEGNLTELSQLWDLRLESENSNPTDQTNTIEAYRKELGVIPPEIYQFTSRVETIALKIVQLPQYQNAIEHRFMGPDLAISRELTEKLYEGVLIATRRVPGLGGDTWTVEKVRNDYSRARDTLKEQVNQVTHIMAASAPCRWGWQGNTRRAEVKHLQFADALFKRFAEPSEFSPELVWMLWRTINNLDELVSNSIEVILLARFYGEEGEKGGRDDSRED